MRILALFLAVAVLGGLAWKATTGDVAAATAPASVSTPAASPASSKVSTPGVDSDPLFAEHAMGSPSAPVTIIEYSSLTCPHCADFLATVFPKLKTDYIDTGKVYFISRDFPLDEPGLKAAMMARCAPADRYFPLIDMLFSGQKTWALAADPVAQMQPLGKFAGMSESDIKSCLANQKLEDFIVAERKDGEDHYKITSTPTFIFNNGAAQFSGDQPYDKFQATIDPLLAKK
jgi:protein-disulfide isomerase